MDYRVSLSLSVSDPSVLWRAAAAAAMAAPGMTIDDVVDTIGSEQDPEIADCIALLLQPPRIDGVTMHDFTCRRAARPLSGAAAGSTPPSRPAPRNRRPSRLEKARIEQARMEQAPIEQAAMEQNRAAAG